MEVWNLQQGKYEVRCFETASVFSYMTCEALQWSLWQKYNLLDKSGSGRSSWRWGHFPQVICLRAAPWAVPHNCCARIRQFRRSVVFQEWDFVRSISCLFRVQNLLTALSAQHFSMCNNARSVTGSWKETYRVTVPHCFQREKNTVTTSQGTELDLFVWPYQYQTGNNLFKITC